MSLLRSYVHSLKRMPCFTKHMTPPPRLSARSFLMWKCPGTQMDSSGMWSLHHVSVIVAISAEFGFSNSESSVIFGKTTGRTHIPHWTCMLLHWTGGLVNVVGREVVITGIFRRYVYIPYFPFLFSNLRTNNEFLFRFSFSSLRTINEFLLVLWFQK